MSFIGLIISIIVLGITIYSRIGAINKNSHTASVQGEVDIAATPSPSASASASPRNSSTPRASSNVHVSEGTSKIDISVDTADGSKSHIQLVYPGAVSVGGNAYETSASGDLVYDWYKNELNSRKFNIRNNVRTKANDKFKGVLQGVNGDSSIKVTIDQEDASAKTRITLE